MKAAVYHVDYDIKPVNCRQCGAGIEAYMPDKCGHCGTFYSERKVPYGLSRDEYVEGLGYFELYPDKKIGQIKFFLPSQGSLTSLIEESYNRTSVVDKLAEQYKEPCDLRYLMILICGQQNKLSQERYDSLVRDWKDAWNSTYSKYDDLGSKEKAKISKAIAESEFGPYNPNASPTELLEEMAELRESEPRSFFQKAGDVFISACAGLFGGSAGFGLGYSVAYMAGAAATGLLIAGGVGAALLGVPTAYVMYRSLKSQLHSARLNDPIYINIWRFGNYNMFHHYGYWGIPGRAAFLNPNTLSGFGRRIGEIAGIGLGDRIKRSLSGSSKGFSELLKSASSSSGFKGSMRSVGHGFSSAARSFSSGGFSSASRSVGSGFGSIARSFAGRR